MTNALGSGASTQSILLKGLSQDLKSPASLFASVHGQWKNVAS